jgi:hypothetical protein
MWRHGIALGMSCVALVLTAALSSAATTTASAPTKVASSKVSLGKWQTAAHPQPRLLGRRVGVTWRVRRSPTHWASGVYRAVLEFHAARPTRVCVRIRLLQSDQAISKAIRCVNARRGTQQVAAHVVYHRPSPVTPEIGIRKLSQRVRVVASYSSLRIKQLASAPRATAGSVLTTFWRDPIPSSATVDPVSAQAVQLIQQAANSQGFLVAAQKWSWPVYHVDSKTPKLSVRMTASWAAKQQLNGVPIPAGAQPSPDADAHLVVIDDSANCEYDLYQARQNADGSWSAGWGNATLTTGSGWLDYSATGSGQALTAGMITPQDMQSGTINHALNFSYPYTRAGGPVLPARESDGTHTDAGALPEGARLQLDPNLDLGALGLSSWQLTIAKALQTYGMYLTDTGGGVSLYAQERQSYPWGADNYAYLPNSLLSHLRVLSLPAQYKANHRADPASPCATFS